MSRRPVQEGEVIRFGDVFAMRGGGTPIMFVAWEHRRESYSSGVSWIGVYLWGGGSPSTATNRRGFVGNFWERVTDE